MHTSNHAVKFLGLFLGLLLALPSVSGKALNSSESGDSLLEVLNSTEFGEKAGRHEEKAGHHGNESERFEIVKDNWNHVHVPFTITLWLLFAGVAKIVFHLSKRLAQFVPDSTLLILLGLVMGGILFVFHLGSSSYHLSATVFFFFLLPPIVFDAGYFMPTKAFFHNLGTILIFAVVGTVWNTAAVGLSLWGCSASFQQETNLLHLLLFSSIISAVDPVAVLVVFEEIHVNELLFIIVFGESLLNDAVTVVLYKIFNEFSIIEGENITAQDITFGFIAFFVVGLGGVLIGLMWGVATAFTTKFTKHVRVMEPFFIFIMAYCSYLTAETFELSGILAIVFCGISMRRYTDGNISQKSHTTIKYALKMLSSSCETLIFIFLGLSTISEEHHWDTAFVLLTLIFCIVSRVIGVVVLSFVVNRSRMHKLNRVSQFIMAYGGLRGAVAYGMVESINNEEIEEKPMFVTACIAVIFFTVFVQGATIKPLVNCLHVEKDEGKKKTMFHDIMGRSVNHMSAGIEEILGNRMTSNALSERLDYINTKYIMPCLMREPPKTIDDELVKTHTRLEIKEAITMVRNNSFVGESFFTIHKRKQSEIFTPTDKHGIFTGGAYGNPSFTMDSAPDLKGLVTGARNGHSFVNRNPSAVNLSSVVSSRAPNRFGPSNKSLNRLDGPAEKPKFFIEDESGHIAPPNAMMYRESSFAIAEEEENEPVVTETPKTDSEQS